MPEGYELSEGLFNIKTIYLTLTKKP